MTRRDRAALGEYVRWVANEMELRDWTIEISKDPAPSDSQAYVSITYGRKLAVIRFSEDFRSISPEQQRQTVAHELVHLHLESASSMVLNDLEDLLGNPADRLFWAGFKRQMEYGVDALGSAYAKHLPLIDWPK